MHAFMHKTKPDAMRHPNAYQSMLVANQLSTSAQAAHVLLLMKHPDSVCGVGPKTRATGLAGQLLGKARVLPQQMGRNTYQ